MEKHINVLWFILLVFTASLLAFIVDRTGVHTYTADGVIIEKRFTPSHTDTRLCGKLITSEYHSDQWDVKVRIDNLSTWFTLNKKEWDRLHIDQKVQCQYRKGRLFKTIYINKINGIFQQ